MICLHTPSRRLSGLVLLPVATILLLAGIAQAQDDFQPRELAVLAPPEVEGVYTAGHPVGALKEPLPPEGIAGLLVHVEDAGTESGEACGEITNAEALAGRIAFVRRGECSFCLKVSLVSTTGALGAVIYNDERVPDDDTSVMNYPMENCDFDILPSLFVSRAMGLLLLDALVTSDVTVRLQPIPTTAADGGPEPLALTLSAYPNPARGVATLTLTLAEAAHVRVEAFDVLGRAVARLRDGPLGAGAHLLHFDTAALPAGAYLVRATSAGGTVARRLVIH